MVRGDLGEGDIDRFAQQVQVRVALLDLTIEMTDATFLPSAAVGVLIDARLRAEDGGRHLWITAAPGTISEWVLTMMGICSNAAPTAPALW